MITNTYVDNKTLHAKRKFDHGVKIYKSNYVLKKLIGQNKFKDALEKFKQAMKIYKNIGDYEQLIICLEWSICCYEHLNDLQHQMQCYIEMYHIYKNMNFNKCIKCINKIIHFSIQLCDIQKIIEWNRILGDEYENIEDVEKAVQYYIESFNYDNHGKLSIQYLLKLANCFTLLGQYENALESYKKIWTKCINDDSLKFRIPQLCVHICCIYVYLNNIMAAKNQLFDFTNLDCSSTFEKLFLEKIIVSFQTSNIDLFIENIKWYDSLKKIDNVTIHMLLKIQQKMKESLK